MQLGSDWFVYQLTERTIATPEGLTPEVRQRIETSLLTTKRQEAVRAFVHDLRERAIAEGQFRTDDSVLDYGDEPAHEDGEEGDEEEEHEEESALHRRRLSSPT
jgi:hypothetical protein